MRTEDEERSLAVKLPKELDGLSKTAKAVGSMFGMMRPGSEGMIFQMQQARPSVRMQQGLDELVDAKVILLRPYNRAGGVQYQPLIELRPLFLWMMKNQKDPEVKFNVTEPLPR